jgi:uncharacterized membrane protein YphA (DoxX/SURF4 family)
MKPLAILTLAGIAYGLYVWHHGWQQWREKW